MSTAPIPHRAAGPTPQRLGAGAALAVAVLLVHVWLVGSGSQRDGAPPTLTTGSRPVQVQVRQITPAAAQAGSLQTAVPLSMPALGSQAATALTARVGGIADAGVVNTLPVAVVPTPAPARTPTLARAITSFAPTPQSADSDPGSPVFDLPSSADSDDSNAQLSVPTYATRPPGAATLTYLWQRGAQQGQARMRWAPHEGGGYELDWVASAPGGPTLGAFSRGGFDSAGLAPERQVERRRGRDLRATNFDRDNGRISFSSSPRQVGLPAGVQDRVTWMLQLPAMFEADPTLATPGTELQIVVAGARGQVGVWTFSVVGAESLPLPAGETSATLHLQRLARRPYDTQVDVWLDPARSHLPVRVRLAAPPAPGGSEWWLQSLTTP